MADSHSRWEAASAEDYFSDNTQGRNQLDFIQRSSNKLEAIRGRRRPKFGKRSSSFGQRLVQHAIKKLSEPEFNARLDKINIPNPNDPLDMLPVLRDGVFSYISELLRQYGQGEWALRPRTFCILRILGCPEAMDAFVKMKRTDAFLPYNDRNLPDAIKGADMREKFLRLQALVLSSQHLKELEQEGGAHFHFRALADECFSPLRTLGSGGAGTVDEVYGNFTLKYFARKRIHRGVSVLKDQDAMDSFEKELRVLKAASHRHLVKLISSYSDPIYVGLIMRPVADQDLKAYLLQSWSTDVDRTAQKQCLRTFFGCLIKALEYLHHNGIIHKDIKPQNVLVKKEEIYFTDFGTSKTIGDASRSFSTGNTGKITERYCAPEVIDQAPRGRPSDIWSIGCVFLEMATVLMGRSLNDLEAYYATHGTTSRYFYKNEEATEGWIEELGSHCDLEDRGVLEWTKSMLKETQTERPTASQIVAKIADTPSDYRYFCFNCLEDDSTTDATRHHSHKASNSDIINGDMLRSYLRRDSIHNTDGEDDTVTSKILEEKGVVSVAVDAEHVDVAQIELSDHGEEDIEEEEEEEADPQIPYKPQPENDTTGSTAVQGIETRDETRSSTVHEGATPPATDVATPLRSSIKLPGTPTSEKEVRFEHNQRKQGRYPGTARRFSALAVDRRPLPSEPVEETVDLEEMPIVAPEPLKPPPLDSEACYPLPKASLVPSYILAGSNRFSMKEVRASDSTMGTHNIFVYGRLMFPSVLRAFAARSTKDQGIYSPMHQRRLVPTSSDWAHVDLSVKNAAEAMTPARLRDYDVWRPSRLECAAIQDSSKTKEILSNRKQRGYSSLENEPPGEVTGFLILGVSDECLRYCDLIFSSDSKTLDRGRRSTDDNTGAPQRMDALLERKLVAVDVQLTSGEYRSLPANTYVWSKRADHLRHPWRPEAFIRGRDFQGMSNFDYDDWRKEEMALAETMKIAYALVGDEMCGAILADDLPKLQQLLDNDEDANARCRKYGTPLQAAVVTGNDEMVRLLLDSGANPSSKGGKYGSPLIAATVGKRRTIARILLKHRADIFESHPQYVNALYQAVGSTDYALTEMLLDSGAWLSTDYGEIRDLAIEKRDRELQNLLLEYDVRDAIEIAQSLEDSQPSNKVDRKRGEDVGFLRKYGPVTKAVLRKMVAVSGDSGSLRGKRGVDITRAALAAGAPPMILDMIRNAVDPVMKLVDMLKASDQQQELKQKAAKARIGHVEELNSDDDSGEDIKAQASPAIRVRRPDDEDDRDMSSSNIPPLPLSRNSSTSSESSSRSYESRDSRPRGRRVTFDDDPRTSSPALDSARRSPRETRSERRNDDHRASGDTRHDSRTSRADRTSKQRSYSPPHGKETRSRPDVPHIVTPSSSRPPPPQPSPTRKTLYPVEPRRDSPEAPPRSPQYLHPPAPRRRRTRSLEENNYTPSNHPVPQSWTRKSSPPRRYPPSPTTSPQRDPQQQGRSQTRRDNRGDDWNGSRLRSSSDSTGQSSCGKCGGLGYYREILRGRSGRDVVREVHCGCGKY